MIFLDFLLIIASLFEFYGAILMANHYLAVDGWFQMLRVMGSSLFGGEDASIAVTWKKMVKENSMVSVKGLAFIAVGFGIQFVCATIRFLSDIVPTAP